MISQTGKQKQNRLGFTFVELLIVVSIISVLIVISVPLLKNTFINLQLSDTAQNIASVIRYCYASSVAEGTPYMLNFDFDGNAYYITKVNPSTGEPEAISGRFGRKQKIPPEIKIEGQVSQINFYPEGSLDAAAFTLKNNNSEYTIETGNLVGIVKVTKK